MKKLLFASLFICTATAVSAQVTTSSVSSTKKEVTKQTSDTDEKIKEALMNDEEVQAETISYLSKNEESTGALSKLFRQNKGSKSGIMKSILGDQKLSTMAIDYVKSNPKLLEKAMSFIGK